MKRALFMFLRKASRSGLWKALALSMLLTFGGCATVRIAGSYMSPYSVSVRGYTRSDGTYVQSHRRRSPGSRERDAPFEMFITLGGLVFLAGLVGIGYNIHRVCVMNPLDLLPERDLSLPERPVAVVVPTRDATARKYWSCAKCATQIRPGQRYYFDSSPSDGRFCFECKSRLAREASEFPLALEAYASQLREYRSHERQLFKRVYGFEMIDDGSGPLQ